MALYRETLNAMTRKKSKKLADLRSMCEDSLLHLEDISEQWIPLLKESIISVRSGRMTNRFRLLLPRICSQLMSSLDYMAGYIQSTCPKPPKKNKAYFFVAGPHDSDAEIDKKLARVFPALCTNDRKLHAFLRKAQRLLVKKPSIFQELRGLNAYMKHRRLLPAGPIQVSGGVSIINWSAQSDRPPMWVWTRRIDMSAESSFAGGPGSLLVASQTVTCENESMIFGYSGEDIYSGKAGPDVEVLDFALLWNVPKVTRPVLQFLGEALNEVARLVRRFVEINGLWEQLWPRYRIAHFGQIFSSGRMSLSPGRVEANWKENGRAPTVSMITWGEKAKPIRD